MAQHRVGSAISGGIRPVRALFTESHQGAELAFFCKLCDFVYRESSLNGMLGWKVSVHGLFVLVRHLRGHSPTS